MGLLNRLLGLDKQQPQPQPRRKKRKYAAVDTGRLFNDFKASKSSADDELKTALDILRDRSRDLARNNEYAKRYFELMKANVVGDMGFTLQVKASDSGKLDIRGNQAVEDGFKAWGRLGNPTVCGKMTLRDVYNTAVESLYRDGEVFIIKHYGAAYKDGFALQIVEPDHIDTLLNKKLTNGNQIKMGVELNQYGRAVAYHIRKAHPNDSNPSNYEEVRHTRITADRVIHAYLANRAGQTRGEPRLSSAMGGLKQLDGLREAQIVACRVGASKMGFFTSPSGDDFQGDDMEDEVPIMEASPATFAQLPTGMSFQSFDPQYPQEFEAFHRAILKGIASGLGVSYTSLSNDLEATSYSSIRQGALEERDMYRQQQRFVIEHVVRPIFESWLAEAIKRDTLFMPAIKFDKFANAAEFKGRAWSWVDPQKEMTAAIMGLKNGVLSLQDVSNQYGKDVEELLSQIAKDKELADTYGINYALEPYGAEFMAVTPDGYATENDDTGSQNE